MKYENPLWVSVILMAVFAIITGYMNTLVYLKLRVEVKSGKILTHWKIETLCRLAGLLSQVRVPFFFARQSHIRTAWSGAWTWANHWQIGGMCGVLFNILFISLGAYSDPVDDDDACWICDD